VITGSENKFKDIDAKYIQDNENEKHDILGSLMVAKNHINGEIIISYSDIIFEREIIEQLYKTKGDIVIAIDLNWKKEYIGRTEHLISEAENVLLDKKNKILQIKKNIKNKEGVVGEFLGLMKMTEIGSKIFLKKINRLQKNHQGEFHNAQSLEKGYLTDMIQEMIDSSIQITPMFISGKWCEIDTKQDLENAIKKFK
jgi:choline kinase